MSGTRSSESALCAAVCSALMVACHPGPSARPDVPAEARWSATAPCDTSPTAPSQRLGVVRPARDSLLRDVQVRRAAWRARGISDYRVRIGMRCFCPFSPPSILEVRGGIPVAMRDSLGRPAGLRLQPHAFTIEALFDLIERAAQDDELVEVSYSCLGYPALIGVDPKGLDNWYSVVADRLATPR